MWCPAVFRLGFGPRHTREAAEHQPSRERICKVARSENTHGFGAHRGIERNVPKPHARHSRHVGVDLKVNFEARVLDAQLDIGRREHQPEDSWAMIGPRRAVESEAHDHPVIREKFTRDPAADIPHQESRIQVLALHSHGPALSPISKRLNGGPKLMASVRELIAVPALSGKGLLGHYPRVLEVAQPAGKQGA